MMLFIPAFVVCFFALCPLAVAADNPDASRDGRVIIAEIDGTPISLMELEHKRAGALFQARTSLYQGDRKALDEYIDEYLLKKEARRENLSVEELLQRHVNSSLLNDPSEEALRVYYEGVDTTEPYEAVRGKILEHLHERRLERARTAYVQSLRAQAHVAIKLSAPRADIRLNETPVRGAEHPPVTLVEYADYECPYCQQIEPELRKLEAEYKGKLSLAYKDVPLPMHSHAQKAAEAARCAGAQGKFWEYHDVVFNTKEYGIPELKRHAQSLNLDTAVFDKCLDSGEQAGTVKSEIDEAQSLGLAGTPSFFLNGRFLGSGVNYETLRREVEQELATVSSRSEQQTTRQ